MMESRSELSEKDLKQTVSARNESVLNAGQSVKPQPVEDGKVPETLPLSFRLTVQELLFLVWVLGSRPCRHQN